MNIFTANQVNQVYVLKSDSTVLNLDADHTITAANNLGSVGLGKTTDGKSIYFKHLGAGGVTRSDLIDINSIMYVKATPASKMSRELLAAKVTLNAEALDSNSKPIAGEDFVLRIKFQNPIGMSPDNQYWKYGVVHATANMAASDFYKKLALSLAGNMAREATKLVTILLTNTTNTTEVTAQTDESTLSGTYDGLLIKEVEQDWIRGIKQQKPLIFTVEPAWISVGSGTSKTEVCWGDVVYSTKKKTTGGAAPKITKVTSGQPTTSTVINSKLMADYEYFYMGERGDQYRMVNWPDYVPTDYLVNPDYQYGYDTVAIHFAYTGANHAVQKSEKDITFIVPRASTDNTASSLGAKANSILTAINAAISTSYTKAEADARFEPKS